MHDYVGPLNYILYMKLVQFFSSTYLVGMSSTVKRKKANSNINFLKLKFSTLKGMLE